MNAQGILNKIQQDARDGAAEILREARRKAEETRSVSDERIAAAREAAMERARQEALALDDRMQRMAKLDARKDLLAAKREVLDEAFARALDKLAAMPAAQAQAFGLSMLLDSAAGDEVLVRDAGSAWCDDAFVKRANEALVAAGKQGGITLSADTCNLGGGFLLRRGGMEINCSYQAALEARRMDIEAEVAACLFDS